MRSCLTRLSLKLYGDSLYIASTMELIAMVLSLTLNLSNFPKLTSQENIRTPRGRCKRSGDGEFALLQEHICHSFGDFIILTGFLIN